MGLTQNNEFPNIDQGSFHLVREFYREDATTRSTLSQMPYETNGRKSRPHGVKQRIKNT